ncbi:hypothetical protein SHAb15599_00099 [Acinetobacter phage SH-Ab 15599]|nr:hypothetical protein SHAb15599_00099 [Acinetobacter phage SH-Ab 15599]
MAGKKVQNYVDNEKLSDAIIEWVGRYNEAKAAGLKPPKPSDYIGKSILDIATNLARHPNFNRYTWKEDMIGDAVENAIKYLHNFNGGSETRTGKPNAFSWLTLSMERVFYDRIDMEKRQNYYKNRLGLDAMDSLSEELDMSQDMQTTSNSQKITNDIRTRVGEYEENQKRRKAKEREKQEKKRGLEAPEPISKTTHSLLDAI